MPVRGNLDMNSNNYWKRRAARFSRADASRRRFLGTAGIGAIGAASWALAGCGGDDETDSEGGNTPPSGSGTQPGGSSTQAPTAAPVTASKGSIVISQASLDTQPGDPHLGTSGVQEPIRFGQGVGLFSQRVNGDIQPAVAESITYSEDGLSYLIKVRQGITFVNGTPLSAEDVAFSLDRMLQSPVSKAQWGTYIEKSEVLDGSNVKVTLKRIAPAWIYTMRGLYTLPKAYVTSLNDGEYALEAFSKAPVGVGPYKLVDNRVGSHITFEAYDKFFLGVPRVKNIRVQIVPEVTTRIAQLQTGESDVVHGLLADHLSTIEDIKDARVVRSEGSGSSELTFFDMMKADSPFRDARVRMALCHAIDRNSIIKDLYRGEAILLNSLFVKNPFTIGYDADLAKTEPFPFDIAKAKELLRAAGYENGFKTEITTYDTTTSPGTPQMMQVVSEQLRQIGVDAPVRFMESGQYVGQFREKKLTGMGPISFPQSADFATTYETHYKAGSAFSYDDWAEGDAMFTAIQSEVDVNKREQMSKDLLRKLSRERVPNITLVAPNALIGIGPKVKDYPRPAAQPYLTHLESIELA